MIKIIQQMKDTITALTKQNNNKGNTDDVADNTVEQTDNIEEEHHNRRYYFDDGRRSPIYTSRRSPNSDTAIIPNMSNLVKSLYDTIPTYNGDRDIQKLQEFIDKVEIYLELAEHEYEEEIALKTIIIKLTERANLQWRYYKRIYHNSLFRIRTWMQLQELLMLNIINEEQ